MHGQSPEQLPHDPLGNGADVQPLDEPDGSLHLRLRDPVRPQAHGQKHPQLFLQGQLPITGVGHIAAHDARRADLHGIEIPGRQLRLIGPEDLVQLLGRLLKDIVRGLLLGICLDIDLPQVLIELRQGHLDGGLHSVDIHRRQLGSRRGAGHGELVGKHELHQLRQDPVLGPENVLENAVGYRRLMNDFGNGGFFVPLFQKQLHAHGEDPLFSGQAGTGNGRGDHILSMHHGMHAMIVSDVSGKGNRGAEKYTFLLRPAGTFSAGRRLKK